MKIQKYNIKTCGLFCLLVCTGLLHAQYSNEVLKVFHNMKVVPVVSESQQLSSDNIDLGNIIFYFSQKPIVNFVPERNDNTVQAQKVFIFPKAVLKNSYCKSNIKNINNGTGSGYSLKIESIKLPIEGVKFSITYDPNIVDFNYKIFESIANEKGVIFNFYNKRLINKIQNKENNVLCIA